MVEHYRQTDKHTDRCDRTHYHAAFAAGNKKFKVKIQKGTLNIELETAYPGT